MLPRRYRVCPKFSKSAPTFQKLPQFLPLPLSACPNEISLNHATVCRLVPSQCLSMQALKLVNNSSETTSTRRKLQLLTTHALKVFFALASSLLVVCHSFHGCPLVTPAVFLVRNLSGDASAATEQLMFCLLSCQHSDSSATQQGQAEAAQSGWALNMPNTCNATSRFEGGSLRSSLGHFFHYFFFFKDNWPQDPFDH